MALAGYSSVIKGPGTSTALTNAACTKLTANTVYRITDAAKRVLDPTVVPVVEVDTGGGYAVAPSSGYTIDYLDAKITFAADQGGSTTVRFASGSYIPLHTIATAREHSLSVRNDLADVSVYGSGERSKIPKLGDFEGSLGVVEDLYTDHDAGGTTLRLTDLIEEKDPVILEINSGGGGNLVRAWVLLDSVDETGGIDDVVMGKVAFKASGNSRAKSFGIYAS